MRTPLILPVWLTAACTPLVGGAQNLVVNGSFEDYTLCPDFWNQMSRATGWSSYRGSADYFNRCDTAGYIDVPTNVVGHQDPATGDGYAGGILWLDFPANNRELFGSALSQPLIPGVPVFLSFRLSPTTGGFAENMRWTCEGAGMRFAMLPYQQNGLDPLPNAAALHIGFDPTDTTGWYDISGMYIPDSAYSYVVLGNFFSDTLVSPSVLDSAATYPGAYAYYDDVCVSYQPGYCVEQNGIDEGLALIQMSAYPMPFFDMCRVVFTRSLPSSVRLQLIETCGRIVWQGELEAGQQELSLSVNNLVTGAYILTATTEEKAFHPLYLVHINK